MPSVPVYVRVTHCNEWDGSSMRNAPYARKKLNKLSRIIEAQAWQAEKGRESNGKCVQSQE